MALFIKGKQIAKQSVSINGVDGNVIAQGNLDMLGNAVIINAAPTSNFEAANKAYVDSVAQGLRPHAPVYVTATSQIESGSIPSGTTYTIDGLSISVDDRVLLTNQGGTGTADSHIYNGLWQVQAGGWIRPEDADGTPENEVSLGDFVYTTSGTTETSSGWVLSGTDGNADGNIAPNVEGQQWVKMAAPGSYTTDGQGIELAGNTFSLELDGTTLSKSATGLKLADAISTTISSNTDGVTSLSTSVSTETSNRISGDASLSTLISTETSTRTSADTSLSTVVSTETSNRISGDASLSTLISTETSTRTSADTSLSTVVSTETSNRVSGDASLSTLISSNTSSDVSLSTVVSTETSNRVSGDTSLSTDLSTEISTRLFDIDKLSTDLSTEISGRTSTDTSLSTALSTEVSYRTSADASLSTAIDNIATPSYSEKLITPSNSGDTTAVIVDASAFPILPSGSTVEEASVMVYVNGLAYPFEWAQGTPAVFHTNNTQPNSSTTTTLYFDGQVAGFAIETDDDVKLKYVVSA